MNVVYWNYIVFAFAILVNRQLVRGISCGIRYQRQPELRPAWFGFDSMIINQFKFGFATVEEKRAEASTSALNIENF